jgi:stage V sporulation protein S
MDPTDMRADEAIPSMMSEIIKVSAVSPATQVAGAIAKVIRKGRRAEVQAIGAAAVNQAVKAVAISRNYLIEDGVDVVCWPSLIDIQISGAERTAVKLLVEIR